MSVSLAQMALWTLVVGGMVLMFGLMHLQVPNIPETLVFLMGFSVTTSVVGHFQAKEIITHSKGKRPGSRGKKGPSAPTVRSLSDLLGDLVTIEGEPDLAKAQMLFWTVITLVLFVVKSLLDGNLWDVPTMLVFLMGISQGGFLARKQMAVRDVKKLKKPA